MRVRIIATPGGEAPLWIRQAWVGKRFEAEPYFGATKGVVTGYPEKDSTQAYAVPFATAVAALEKSNPQAAAWWRANEAKAPRPNRMLIFDRSVCQVESLPELDIQQPPPERCWG